MKIPVVPTNKPAGHLKEYVSNPVAFLHKHWTNHGDIYQFRVAYRNLIFTSDPDHVKQLLQEDHSAYRKNLAYRKLKLLLGDGLFTGEGKSWLQQRRLAQPAFHKERLSVYVASMQEAAGKLAEQWQSKEEVNVVPEMTAVTLRIISKALLNIDQGEEGNKVIEDHLPYALDFMIRRITSPVNMPMFFPVPKHIRFRESVREMDRMIRNLIKYRRDQKDYGDDLLSMLMQARDAETGETMGDRNLRNEILTFFLAGHETTAMTMSWMLYLLAVNPDAQERLRSEIRDVYRSEAVTPDQLHRMTYTQNVIKETMRMFSPIWIMGREALIPGKLGEYLIKRGDSIIFSSFLIHRHPRYWQKPEEFNPDRFSHDEGMKQHKYAYFPFGGGPRLCIGNSFAMMEMQVLLSEIAGRFRFQLVDKSHPDFHFSLTLRPKKEIRIRLEKI